MSDNSLFPSNHISSTKYNILNILPKNIIEQFKRLANIWFLIVSILQVLPFNLSPTSSWATIVPLCFVLITTLAKDAYQDLKRYKNDKEINNRPARIWNDKNEDFQQIKWKEISVGNILVLEEDEQVPADVVIFATTYPDKACFVETSNLDGETNLKVRHALDATADIFDGGVPGSMKMIHLLDEGVVKTENPNTHLSSFIGSLKLKSHPKNISIDNSNVILRGSMIKNTKAVLAFVVYTGSETKYALNQKKPSFKHSCLEQRVNKYLYVVFGFMLAMAVICTTISVVRAYKNPTEYKIYSDQDPQNEFVSFFTFVILFNNLVPISLYVSMDIVRLFQSKFIQWDLNLYSSKTGTPAQVSSIELNENLGQIEFIFSDKTGTLTENQMKLKKCWINGKTYSKPEYAESEINKENRKFCDPAIISDLNSGSNPVIPDFLEVISLCHTVIAHKDETLKFQASSPDEEALVLAAHCLGYSFISNFAGVCTLEIKGIMHNYRIIGLHQFTSERKRMSIVLETLDSQRNAFGILLCKGADNVLLNRVNGNVEEIEEFNCVLNYFASEGLRVLIIARKELTKDQLTDYKKKYEKAKNAMSDRDKRLEEVAEEFETNLQVVGITGIEDKIQEEVPETITKFLAAGIKVWMLTGDKQETAINIGYRCKLMNFETKLIKLNINSVESAKAILKTTLNQYLKSNNISENNDVINLFKSDSQRANNSNDKKEKEFISLLNDLNIALIVDGQSLLYVLSDIEAMKYFLMLGCCSITVICCRVSPSQKAKVVKLVKEHLAFKPITLSIGDGANDVPMIQKAHVGVGIIGQEGLQAVNNSDYAISKFKYLYPLLFTHGRWNYSRISRLILYSFYKNFLLVLPMFYFAFLSMFSGTALYDSWLLMSYNIFFTAVPIIILAITDKDLPRETVLSIPILYSSGIHSKLFNAKTMMQWIFLAVVESLLIFTIVVVGNTGIEQGGYNESFILTGTSTFLIVVLTATVTVFLLMKEWTLGFILITVSCPIFAIAYIALYDYTEIPTEALSGNFINIFSRAQLSSAIWLVPFTNFAISFTKVFLLKVLLKKSSDKYKIAPATHDNFPESNKIFYKIYNYANNFSSIFINKNKKLSEKNSNQNSDFSMGAFSLKFHNTATEKLYMAYSGEKSLKFSKVMLIIIFVSNLIWTIYDLASNYNSPFIFALRILSVCFTLFMVIFIYTPFFLRHYDIIITLAIILSLLIKAIVEFISTNDDSISTAVSPVLVFVVFSVSTYKIIFIWAGFLLVYLIRTIVIYSTFLSDLDLTIITIDYTTLLLSISIISAYVGYTIEFSKRKSFVLLKKLESEYQKGQKILGNLLPNLVKDRVSHGIRYIAEQQFDVSVLFCDICDFDKICSEHSPQELIDLLDKFFSILDNLCIKHGVTKIETVNKTYMVCGGLKSSEVLNEEQQSKSPAVRVVELALDILKKMGPVYLKNNRKFSVKIGINTGDAIAGVVGSHKPQFSLVGDTINIASRMCSTITKPDTIRISESTYDQVRYEEWSFELDSITYKGIEGYTDTYFVSKKQSKIRIPRRMTIFDKKGFPIKNSSSQITPAEIDFSTVPLIPDKRRPSKLLRSATSFSIEKLNSEKSDLEDKKRISLASNTFKDKTKQREFVLHVLKTNFHNYRKGLVLTCATYLINSCTTFAYISFHPIARFQTLQICFRVCVLTGLILFTFFFQKIYKKPYYFLIRTSMCALCLFSSIINMYKVYPMSNCAILELMYNNIIMNHIGGMFSKRVLIMSVVSIVVWTLFNLYNYNSQFVENTIFLISFIIFNLSASYMKEYHAKNIFELQHQAQNEISNTEKLLKQMMPKPVYRNLEKGITTTDQYYDVSIIYADICGFTAMSKQKTPMQVVGMLSKLFTQFDELCVKHDVYKVHTIGDCYVILSFGDWEGGSRDPVKECVNMVNMAIDMIKTIKKFNLTENIENKLEMRVGIHTGNVIAGITGLNIVRYDIYGPDVEIANKMESRGAPGKINISEDTRNLLTKADPMRFEYIHNTSIEHSPTKRTLNSYFLQALNRQDTWSED
ncbi:hypothetical protein SteCoe_25265 [Stentor coeruleus]|uniref:P-type phospholipid transporter n=1 Tax=Stentor coeruleus TaxID=5963 RepID=A0A1R2BFK6_9CILI|nr:hypothetical protein SteCoe_25265 [Stentor coeruleus]